MFVLYVRSVCDRVIQRMLCAMCCVLVRLADCSVCICALSCWAAERAACTHVPNYIICTQTACGMQMGSSMQCGSNSCLVHTYTNINIHTAEAAEVAAVPPTNGTHTDNPNRHTAQQHYDIIVIDLLYRLLLLVLPHAEAIALLCSTRTLPRQRRRWPHVLIHHVNDICAHGIMHGAVSPCRWNVYMAGTVNRGRRCRCWTFLMIILSPSRLIWEKRAYRFLSMRDLCRGSCTTIKT